MKGFTPWPGMVSIAVGDRNVYAASTSRRCRLLCCHVVVFVFDCTFRFNAAGFAAAALPAATHLHTLPHCRCGCCCCRCAVVAAGGGNGLFHGAAIGGHEQQLLIVCTAAGKQHVHSEEGEWRAAGVEFEHRRCQGYQFPVSLFYAVQKEFC